MTDYKQGFQGPYVTAVQIGDATPTLTIDRVELTEIPAIEPGKPARDRWVIFYREAGKGMVLNRTNAECLVALWGRDVEQWKGHRVTLHTVPVRVGGKTEPGIRILGTPEITEPKTVQIKLPRKRPFPHTLQPTGKAAAKAEPATAREPGDDTDNDGHWGDE